MYNLHVSLIFMCSFLASAQTVTIGTGTDVNANTTASPVNIYYLRQTSQTIYTASELSASGFSGPGAINKIGFFVENAPLYAIPGYTIKIKHTVLNNVMTAVNVTGIQTVKNPYTYMPTAGDFDMITLDNPFNWNGIDNILIEICWSQITPTWNASGTCRLFPSTDGYRYLRDDSNGDICGLVSVNVLDTKPQIRITFDESSIWTGNNSNEWTNPLNWNIGVPDKFLNAIIPNSAINFPMISDSVVCNNLINDGTLSMNENGHLNLFGNLTNYNLFEDGGGKLSFRGSNASVIDNQSNLEINNLNIVNTDGVSLIGNEIVLKGSLDLSKSTLNTNDILTLRSDVNGTARIGTLKSDCSYLLNMNDSYGDGWNGGYLELYFNGALTETYSASGYGSTVNFSVPKGTNFELYYFSGTWENENTYELLDINSIVVFADGTNPNVGLAYAATADCQFVELITGKISMERYIDAGATYWRNIGSAVQGATISQFNDDFTTAGYVGSLFPNFTFASTYYYDETLDNYIGYLVPAGANIMSTGQGWQIYSGDNLQGTNSFTFDLKGVPNQGPITIPVTYTLGTDGLDGWCLISNPYPSTIDWNATEWEKVNVGGAIYILDPDTEQYATYVNGASTNGGSPLVASQQSFWVRTFDIAPSLIADENVKVSTDQAFIKSSTLSQGMTVRFGNGTNYDEVVIRHLDNATDNFEFEVDAEKYWSPSATDPQLAVINGEQKDLTVHSFNKGIEEWMIPLRAIVSNNGIHYLEFYNTQEIDVPCMYIEDSFTGDNYPVTEGISHDFMMYDTTTIPRFILHIGKNYMLQTVNNTCFGQENGVLLVNLDTTLVTYELTSTNGASITGDEIANPFLLNDLASDNYHLEIFGADNLCGQVIFDFVISEPTQVQTTATINPEFFGNDGSIKLNSFGGTPPYTYEWTHGPDEDSIYDLTPGVYQVNISDDNHCSAVVNYNVNSVLGLTSSEQTYSVIFNRQNNTISVTGINFNENETLYMIDMRGRSTVVEYKKLVTSAYIIELSDVASGIYTVYSSTNKIFNYKFFIE